MKGELSRIASNMKRRALDNPGMEILPETPLANGARLKLKYISATYEFRLQVQRYGERPQADTRAFKMWLTELSTFGRYFGAPTTVRVLHQPGKQSYAAVLSWFNEDAMNKDYAQWAMDLGKTANETQGAT